MNAADRGDSTACADLLSDWWADEGCHWHLDYDQAASASDPWTAVLEWTTENAWLHDAWFVTFTWHFYGRTADDAVTEALSWVSALRPWTRCAECDGQGEWNGQPCEDCAGSGLAYADLMILAEQENCSSREQR